MTMGAPAAPLPSSPRAPRTTRPPRTLNVVPCPSLCHALGTVITRQTLTSAHIRGSAVTSISQTSKPRLRESVQRPAGQGRAAASEAQAWNGVRSSSSLAGFGHLFRLLSSFDSAEAQGMLGGVSALRCWGDRPPGRGPTAACA